MATLPENIDEGLQPPQLDQLGRILANEVARLGKSVAEYEINYKAAEKAYKRALAAAIVLNNERGLPATIVKAKAETAPEVTAADEDVQMKEALLITGKAELEGRDKQQQMVKKLLDLRVQELRTFRG
jgi:hypothetical protein